MGYMTTYELECDEENFIISEDFQSLFERITGGYTLEDTMLYDAKWYDHEKHMLKISKMYPFRTFTLYGDGESDEDKWVDYYKNGQRQGGMAEIVYPKIDPKGWK